MDFGKSLLLSTILSLFTIGNAFATDFYWVNNSGNWNDASHWSNTSGGNGGIGVPSANDAVFFDIHSFTQANQTVTITNNISFNNLSINEFVPNFKLQSDSDLKIDVYGIVDIKGFFLNEIKSSIYFKSTQNQPHEMYFGWYKWKADMFFEGNGSYIFKSPLQAHDNKITLVSGTVNLNGFDVLCASFISNSPQKRKLVSIGSTILSYNYFKTNNTKFNYDFSQTIIYVISADKNAVDKGGDNYFIQQSKSTVNNSNKVIINEAVTNDTVSCGNNCDGSVFATWLTPCPTSFVDWLPGNPTGDCPLCPIYGPPFSDTIFNLCPGFYTAVIKDSCDNTVVAPQGEVKGHQIIVPIVQTFTSTTCKDSCDGTLTLTVTGAPYAIWNLQGLPPINTWENSTTTSITIDSLCAGTYEVEASDGFGCLDTFTFVIPEPPPVNPNVTTSNVLCFGYCTGTATSSPTGGTGPGTYTYDWNAGAFTTPGITSLCAGSIDSVLVTDANGCVGDTIITITSPPQMQIDTLTQNVSCGGVCDGQITSTVLSGGVANYTHNWSNGVTVVGAVSTISGLCAGPYCDTIVDANGCDTLFCFVIGEPDTIRTTTAFTDLTCNAICNGTATTTPTGGVVGTYSYVWASFNPVQAFSGQGTDSIFNLCPGQYYVTVNDANGCSVSDTITISEPPPIAVNPSSTNVTCPGFNDGTATANPTGGTGNPAIDFTYSWTGPACSAAPYNTQSIASLCPGTYIVTVTDSAGCTAIDSVIISEPPPLNLIMNFTNETCFGACNGTADVTATGGTGNPAIDFTYLWSANPIQAFGGQGTDAIFNLCAGDYTVNVTDSVGCTANNTVTIAPVPAIVANLVTTDLTCNSVCNGTATVSPTGGTGPYFVSWDGAAGIGIPIAGSNTITGLCAGTHTALITDANNCTLLVNFVINEPPPLTTSTTTNDISCFGLCDGDATTTPAGGTAPYVPIWNTISGSGPIFPFAGNPINALCAGDYYVTVTDDSLCTVNDTITIFSPFEIFPNATFTNITCNGLNNGTAVSTPTGGAPPYVSIVWTDLPTGTVIPGNGIGPLGPGQYIVTVTDFRGCTGKDTVTIIDPPLLTVSANATAASCGTICDGTAIANPAGGTPGYTYQWNDPASQITQIATGLCAGIYTVTVTDSNGCTAQDTAQINNLIVIAITPTAVGLSCNGTCDGTATASPSGGLGPYTFTWVTNNPPVNGQGTDSIFGLCPGWVYVTVCDANGCCSTDSINMPIAPPVLFPNGQIDQLVSCAGACDARVSHNPTGGTPPYTSVWSIPDTNNVCPPFAVITITDANGCIQPDTLFITDPTPIVPNDVVVDVLCNGNATGSITLTPTGGTGGTYFYVWSPLVSVTNSASGLGAGIYTVTVSDSNGCSIVVTDTVNQALVLSSNPIGINVSCFGACDGMMAVTVSGGVPPYNYVWCNNQPIPPASPDTLFNVCSPPGTNLSNCVTVTDANGCQTSQNIVITEPALLNANVTGTNEGCTTTCDGTALSSPTGGTGTYSYQWSANAAPNILTNPAISNLCPDSFSVVVTDNNGCTANGYYIVTTPVGIAVTLDSTNVTCNGFCNGTATASPTSGTAPYSYSWVGGSLPGPDTNSTISNLCPGIYTVSVTDVNGCIFVGSVNITEPQPINDNEVIVGANCGVCDGSIVMFPSGGTAGYTHSWSNGVLVAPNPNLCAGFYTDTITDAQGCVALFTIAITNPTGPSGIAATVNDATCFGACDGSLNAIPIGGVAPYTWGWTGPGGFSGTNDSTQTGLCAGTYNLTLTENSTSCVLATTLVIGESDSITSNPTFTDATCNGICDGTASVTPTGGKAPYSFVWSSNGSTASSIAGLCVGPVSVTITDFFGCTNVVNFNISSPNALTVTSTTVDPTCNASCDGSATANPVGGTSPYIYQWDDPLSQTLQIATGLCAGTYNVTVTDFNGCSGNDVVVLIDPTLIIPNTVTTNSTCGNNDGTANVCGSTGGTGIHTYFWPSLGTNSCNVTGLAAGTYTVEITDGNSCMQSFLITISDATGPTVNVATINASCNGACNGQATASVTSGNPNYSYLWTTPTSPPQPTTPTITGLCAGNYTVQVTDGVGCITTQPVTITDNAAITATVTTIDATCNGTCNGSALVVPNGGVPPYAFSWTGGNAAGQTINAVGGLCAGNYTVTITDFIGCSFIQNVTINQANVLTVSIAGIAANCNGSCDGQATANPVGGTGPYTYSWSTNASTPTVTALCAGNYTVTVTDINGCTANANINIGDGVAITATINTVDATCGLCDGSITVAGNGGSGGPYTYLWTINGLTTPTLNNLCPGAYNVVISDNVNCTQSFNILISNANGPTLTTLADSVTCFGTCDGLAYTNVTAGNPTYIYQWDDPLLQTNDSATALCAGLYNVIVQDGVGCITVDSVTVLAPQEIFANLTFTNPTCPGACDGTVTANPSGGVVIGPYTYLWIPTGDITQGITGLCAGTYAVMITDDNGCSVIDSVTLVDPTPITITISSTPPTCFGDCNGTAVANASGGNPGYQYSWNTVPVQNNSLVGGLCATFPNYVVVTVTDINNCMVSDSVQIIDSPVLTTVSVASPLTCSGVCDGSITTTPAGGASPYTYIWSNGDTTQTTVNTLCAGVYNVIVVDANNCTAYDTITLNAAPVLNDNTAITGPGCGICNGQATSTPIGGVGPFDFVWTSTVSPFPILQTDLGLASSTINGLCAGTVDLQITDQGTGCSYNYTIIVNSLNGPILTMGSTDETCASTCNGTATVSPSGGTAPYTYSWSPTGPPSDTNQTATGLCVGQYTVTVTDSNMCISSDTISINTAGLNLSITSVVPETCFGACDGSATVSVSGGTNPYAYSWNTGPVQITPQATGLCVGLYTVTVTDNILCSDSISANITGPAILTVTASENTPISCFGICDGAAIANVVGGNPNFIYSWNDPANQTTQIATGLCAGTYIVTVTDNNGCTAMDTIILTEPTAILDNGIPTPPACGLCDGQITVAPTGGTGPYSYLWTTPTAPPGPQPVTATINNLCAGAYTLSITDLTGCTANFAYPLSNVNAPVLNTTVTNITCNGLCDGLITSAPAGGVLPYSYFWTFTGDTTQNISGLCVGQYSLEVTDSVGCIGVAIDSVTEPAILQGNLLASNVNCNGVCDGWVVSNTTGGTGPYGYSWTSTPAGQVTTGQNTDSISDLCLGTYLVTITDANSCPAIIDSVTITEPTTITATATQVDVTCTINCDGSAIITPAGGIGPYTFEWNGNTTPGQSGSQVGLCFGLNTVLISDQNGCSLLDSINIGATDTVLADAGLDTTICLNETANLNGIPAGVFTGVEWFALPSMVSLGTTNSISVIPTTVGVFCYAFQVTGACVYTDTVCVTVDPLPNANAGPDVTIFQLASTNLNATGGFTYSWTPGTGLSDSTISNPIATPSETTTYYVTVTSANGCSSIDSVVVTVLPNIVFPDGITPNGDGKNDTWVIDFIEQFPNNVVEIYNRWGELLFHADGYLQNWDGTYNGKELPIGTYYYIIDLHEETIQPFTGPITVLR